MIHCDRLACLADGAHATLLLEHPLPIFRPKSVFIPEGVLSRFHRVFPRPFISAGVCTLLAPSLVSVLAA